VRRDWLRTFGASPALRFGLALGLMGIGLREARAHATEQTEEQRIAEVLQATLVAHGSEVHRCFEKALADKLDVAGKIELSVDVGAEGHVTKAEPALDEVRSPVLLACLEESAQLWTMVGIDAGSTVIVPLTFEGQVAQFSIKAADAPDHGPPAPKHKRKGLQTGVAPYSVKLLVDEATMRAEHVSLSLLTVSPANRIAMHRHPGAEVLYVLKGHARVIGPQGRTPEKIDEGEAIFIPGGFPHAIENMGRSAPAIMLEIFAPLGPEKVYRDPKDEAGRAAFEVIRDPRQATVPEGTKLLLASAAGKAETIAGASGKVRVHPFFNEDSTGDKNIYVGLLDVEGGAEIPRHSHDDSEEILYILAGAGDLTVGSDKIKFGREQAIHIPAAEPHTIKFHGDEKGVVIQVFAPGGPEKERFKPVGKARSK
jgi:quercetin dioxygenase-like cupin family protein